LLPTEVRHLVRENPDLLPPPADSRQPSKPQEPPTDTRWPQILDALEAEARAVRSKSRHSSVDLNDGRLQARTEHGAVVVYELDGEVVLQEGAPVDVQVPDLTLTIKGEVIAIAGARIQLWLKDVDKVPPKARLDFDASHLLYRRQDFIREHLSLLNSDMIERVLAPATEAHPPATGWDTDVTLNPEQRRFVGLALTNPVTWLWGPPGTGKTTTLAVLVEQLRRRGERVLFVSNTNTAVDTALLRTAADGGFGIGNIVRLGPAARPEVQSLPVAVTVADIAALRGDPVAAALQECEAELTRLRAKNLHLLELAGVTPAPAVEGEDHDLTFVRQHDRHFDADHALESRVGYLVDRRQLLRDMLNHLIDATITAADVVFATVHQTYLKRLTHQRFDAVIIDEASMVSADLSLIAAGYANVRVVIAGDFRQLGPIATGEGYGVTQWLKRSIFELTTISSEVAAGTPRPTLVALRTQHRMRAAIADLVSDVSYRENTLHTGANVGERPVSLHIGATADPLVLLDTSDLRPWMGRLRGRGSRFNPMHVAVVSALLGSLHGEGSVGAIAAFAPQAALLRTLLPKGDESRAASTVHRFQGGERDVIFWDATIASGGDAKRLPWFNDTQPFEEGPRLANVAISRPRDQLVIIADMAWMRQSLDPRGVTHRILRHVREKGTVISAASVMTARCESPEGTQPAAVVGRGMAEALHWLSQGRPDYLTLWTSRLPEVLEPAVMAALRSLTEARVPVYLRSAGAAGRNVIDSLHDHGVSIRFLQQCVEHMAFGGDRLVVFSADPSTFTPHGSWWGVSSRALVGALRRLTRREFDPKFDLGESDRVSDCGHPATLVFHGTRDGLPALNTRCSFCRR